MEQKPILNNNFVKRVSPLDDLRKSFDIRNVRSKIHSVNRATFDDDIEQRDSLSSKNSAQVNELKLTSLKERRSITMGLKMNKKQNSVESSILVDFVSKLEEKASKHKPKETLVNIAEEEKNQQINALSHIIADMLNNFEDNEVVQLE
jgi:hypothetical protein